MRLPRHDTPLSLSAEQPAQALAADEALLLERGVRWWLPRSPAIVVGLGLKHKLAEIVDLERCRQAGVDVLERRAGGGALLLDNQLMLCGAIAMPTPSLPNDITESYRWLGDRLVRALSDVGIEARRVEIAEARQDTAALRASPDQLSQLLLHTCYGALSPHEVVVGDPAAKLIGLAQIRRKDASLFQFGILLCDQSPLADYLLTADELSRDQLRAELRRRTIGLDQLTNRSVSEVAAAIADATPCAP